MEAKHSNKITTIDKKKIKLFLRTVLNQNNSELNVEALTNLLSTSGDANGALSSSPSTHAPNNHKVKWK